MTKVGMSGITTNQQRRGGNMPKCDYCGHEAVSGTSAKDVFWSVDNKTRQIVIQGFRGGDKFEARFTIHFCPTCGKKLFDE